MCSKSLRWRIIAVAPAIGRRARDRTGLETPSSLKRRDDVLGLQVGIVREHVVATFPWPKPWAEHSVYVFCGPVRIESPEDISGDRPMNIRWRLEVPLPIGLFQEFSVLRAGE